MAVAAEVPLHIEDPVTEETRYGVYELRDRRPHEIATTSRDGIGLCLVTLSEDRSTARINATPVVGILDRLERRWITSLWYPKEAS